MSLLINFGATLLAFHLPISAQLGPDDPGADPGTVVPTDPQAPEEAVPTDERERALLLLSGYHGIPSRETFEQSLSNPQELMLDLATDPAVSPIHRDRAIGALSYWPSATVRDFYASLLDSAETPEMVRHRVLGHLAVAFGDVAIDMIAPYLGDDDLQFRMTAVHVLGEIGTSGALQLLEAAAATERSQVVLEAIQRVTQ
jgi:hypothetical protein